MTTEDVDDLQAHLQHQDTGVVTIQAAPIVAALATQVHVDGTTAIIQGRCFSEYVALCTFYMGQIYKCSML